MNDTRKIQNVANKAAAPFMEAPVANIESSRFSKNHNLKTTFNTGELVPIYYDDIMPGDIMKIDVGTVIRGSTPFVPVMDSAYLYVYAFFVPNRLVMKDWKKFMGENDEDKWFPDNPINTIPSIAAPAGGWDYNSVADYYTVRPKVAFTTGQISSLHFRGYALIWNEWFRDQNLQDPALFTDDSNNANGVNGGDPLATAIKGGALLPVAKIPDLFTKALPSPQKGEDVFIPLGSLAPVVAIDKNHQASDVTLKWAEVGALDGGSLPEGTFPALTSREIGGLPLTETYQDAASTPSTKGKAIVPSNLWTDLSTATGSTINDLRYAFALQRLYEKDAIYGTRYVEMIKGHFGVTSPDMRQQRPELIGQHRFDITQGQVLQTTPTPSTPSGDNDVLGNTGAFSLSGNVKKSFIEYGSTEHGIMHIFACVKTKQTYSYGLNKSFSRLTRKDFYDPVFAHLGYQPIYNREIFADASRQDGEVFGYQQAWQNYRTKPDNLTGSFRMDNPLTLKQWHYGIELTNRPVLGNDFIKETSKNVDRTLAVKATVSDQWIADFFFKVDATRPMPLDSEPGQIGGM